MMERRRLVALWLVVLTLVLGACSSDADSDTATDVQDTEQPTAIAPAEPDDDPAGDTDPVAPTPEPAVEPTAPPEPVDTGVPFMESWGLPPIVQLTPVTGAGQRPLFEWEPVDRAVGYSLFVYTPDGTPYWSWAGPDTSTYLGGAVQLDDDKPGPRIIDGMSWVVSALDEGAERIAVSEQRWVSP